jgi:ribosomal protein L3 glutamine methyltransferase
MMTLLALLQWAEARLHQAGVAFGQGTTNAHDEAAWLVLWRLGLPLDTLVQPAHPDHADQRFPNNQAERPVSAAERAAVEALIEQRIATRQPAAYLTGEAWLQGIPFHIDPRSIVPRSLIAEILAEGSADPWLHPQTSQVLDLCTGNGSLAVLAAMAYPDVQVTASDLSAPALAIAQANVARHDLSGRITLVQADGLPPGTQVFDLVLCNPPYVNQRSMAALPPEFRAEPSLALDGGTDGMDFIRPLLAALPARLSRHGVLILEIGHEQAYFEAAFPSLDPVWLSTSAGDDQVLLLTRDDLQPRP